MKKLFIGIDFSKKTFDAAVVRPSDKGSFVCNKFDNNTQGFRLLRRWVKKCSKGIAPSCWLFCGENTGSYSIPLSDWLSAQGLYMWIENAYVLKCSMGLVRGKDDKTDSIRIAQYAMRMSDEAREYVPMSAAMKAIRRLMRNRDGLVKCSTALTNSRMELEYLADEGIVLGRMKEIDRNLEKVRKLIKEISEDIKKQLDEIMMSDEELSKNYHILMSFTGISTINTAALLLYTDNFRKFDTPNKLACYWGVAPFSRQSGTSVHSPAHCSPICNQHLKALLTQATLCAIMHDKNMRAYYLRLIERGKSRQVAMNDTKSKILHILFAMVKSGTTYDSDYYERNINEIRKRRRAC